MIWELLVFLVLLNAVYPRVAQLKTLGVKDQYFKLIKLKKSAFLFSAASGQDAKKHGVTIPMLFVQIFGYAMAVVIVIVTVVLYYCKVNDNTMALVIGVLTFVNLIVTAITILVTERVANLRDQRNYKPIK